MPPRAKRPKSTYRSLGPDEPDPPGKPLIYTTSFGHRRQRWKIADRTYVERTLRDEFGEPIRAWPLVAKRIDRAEARKRYEVGQSLPRIAREMDCSTSQLSRALRQEGVVMRSGSGGRPFDAATAIARYLSGEGYVAISRDMGVAGSRVQAVLRAEGLTLRGSGRLRGRGLTGGPVTYETEFQAVRPLVRERSGGRCEAGMSERCSGRGTHVHHRKLRSQGGSNDLANLLDVCAWCHSTIHHNPARSYDLGLLLRGSDDETPFVKRRGD